MNPLPISRAGGARTNSPGRAQGWRALTVLAGILLLAGCLFSAADGERPTGPRPNILFVILDDVGIDQLATLGYGGATPPATPTLDTLAQAGLRFRNTWSMPECSPGRAAMFVGRYPLRTQVQQAIGASDLANSHVTPFDLTTPKLLAQGGYESALFGKFHLGGPENNEDGNGMPRALGWDHFHGWVGGLPASIDTTAGGVAPPGTYACGFVPRAFAGGADFGACRQPDGSCTPLQMTLGAAEAPGKQCLASGGIFVPRATCATPAPSTLDFNRENAYYVSPLVRNTASGVEAVALTDPRARGYRTTLETDAAIAWIRSRDGSRPWMATLSFSAAHTPAQQPPPGLLGSPRATDGLDCRSTGAQRELTNQMIEAVDTSLGRLMVETGLATRRNDGSLLYDPQASRTLIVVVGDNGSVARSVKLPFDPERAKSTAYQTGVWVPLLVAGPQVVQPGRTVEAMVNTVDLFRLFAQAGGVDAPAAFQGRRIDGEPMLAYLTNPAAAPIRTHNFTQGGFNLQAGGRNNGPCILGDSPGYCSQTPMSKSICEDNGGVWWGAGATDASVPAANRAVGYENCCKAVQAVYQASAGAVLVSQLPASTLAVRDPLFKLVRNSGLNYVPATDSCASQTVDELYPVDQALPVPQIDRPAANLMLAPLTASLQQVYQGLVARLETILSSQPVCPWDGNRDGVVDENDVTNAQAIASRWGLSSIYDVNIDGLTNEVDVQAIRSRLGPCPS